MHEMWTMWPRSKELEYKEYEESAHVYEWVGKYYTDKWWAVVGAYSLPTINLTEARISQEVIL